jgi:hypothetical protein
MNTHDLKPCQREAYKNFEHDDSYFITLRTTCPVRCHRAGAKLDRFHLSGEIYHRAKLEVIGKLCEGCKEVGSCENA